MAVAQGYGKTVTSGSVFVYDTGDIVNCYVGEPTTNLIPSPTVNALPTTGNSWGTYNTNQYCGNNGCGAYWNLATVSSISSNIVTTSTAHGLRTYDVINPETTGGGVTAGTQYFVKAISTTQFSLHAYNGSQDGSQGYINPATGTFKVHDSIALDQKVSINSSSFPTKWFGNPHQPNSGLVKEIRTNGYRNPYTGKFTDCIRIHIPRPTGVDGMSYGADASVTIGQTYTTSFWVKSVSETAVGRGVYFQHYNYGGPGGYAVYDTSFTLGPVGQWQRVSFSYTVAYNTLISYWFPNGDYVYSFDLANIQIENKSHATPFVPGTRSATQGLLPLVGTSTVNLSTVSFNSNAQMIFDGTDDTLDLGIPVTTLAALSNFTMECVVKIDNYPSAASPNGYGSTTKKGVLLGATYYSGVAFYWAGNSSGTACNVNAYIRGADAQRATGTYNLTPGSYHHLMLVNDRSNTTLSLYANGVRISQVAGPSQEYNATLIPNAGNIGISKAQVDGGGTDVYSYLPVNIPVTKIYTRALSAGEVRQNYLHYKTRFNLS